MDNRSGEMYRFQRRACVRAAQLALQGATLTTLALVSRSSDKMIKPQVETVGTAWP